MSKLSETQKGMEWVEQFHLKHQEDACSLLDAISLISHEELIAEIRCLLKNVANDTDGTIALFSEREVRRGKGGIPHAIYKQPRNRKNRRAYGSGPQPVHPKRAFDLTVGSEGIFAWLISDICKEHPKQFISHPSPSQVRNKKVRKFVVVTDMIGSGQRICEYLDAFWKVASVKSWKSLKLIDFSIVSFSGTKRGIARTKKHKAKPEVLIAKSCPTISSEFDESEAKDLRSLCIDYDPIDHDRVDSLGYKGSETLIVFSHGCPNNAPRVLFKRNIRQKWEPMFPARSTTSIQEAFKFDDNDDGLRRKLLRLNEKRLADNGWIELYSKEARNMLLLLAALRKKPRDHEAISRRTGLNIPYIKVLIESARSWGWLDSRKQITMAGKGQLRRARNSKQLGNAIEEKIIEFYFPKSLRAPVNASSSR